MPEPLIQMDGNGEASILSYNVHEPTSYNGQRVVELMYRTQTEFSEEAARVLPPPQSYGRPNVQTLTEADVRIAMRAGFPPDLFPGLGVPVGSLLYVDDTPLSPRAYYRRTDVALPNGYYTVRWDAYIGIVSASGHNLMWTGEFDYKPYSSYQAPTLNDPYLSPALASLSPERVLSWLKAGYRLVIDTDATGRLRPNWVPFEEKRTQILLIEKLRLTTYLGNYGAGRTLQTFSLLPGEKTKITLKTYQKTVSEAKAASSILDSYTNESAEEFEQALTSEQTDKEDEKQSHEWHVEAEAEANWGFVAVKASAGYKGSTNASREQFARNMTNATQKHTAKASSKRDISVTQTQETKEETGEEQGIEREIQNINTGRTLNFVFRQMNQEFHSILHLIDVQLGFCNGTPEVKRFSLGECEQLLDLAVCPLPRPPDPPLAPLQPVLPEGATSEQQAAAAQAYANAMANYEVILASFQQYQLAPYQAQLASVQAQRNQVFYRILGELLSIHDHLGQPQAFVAEEILHAPDTGQELTRYWRTRTDMTSIFEDPQSDARFELIPGIILATTKTVMRTDGIIVESVLGQGNGLDPYSQALQTEAVRTKRLENALQAARIQRNRLAAEILTSKDADKAKLYGKLFPTPPLTPAAPTGTTK